MDNIDGRISRAPIGRRKRTDEQLCDRVSAEFCNNSMCIIIKFDINYLHN